MMTDAPKLVLFDCDGTLVDSQVMIVAAMTQAFQTAGLVPPSREAVLSIVGLSLPIAIARLLAEHPDLPVDPVVEAYKAAFFTLRQSLDHHEPLFPHARAVIEDLAARPDTILGVVTGKSRRGLDAILALHGLGDHFVILRTADDAPSKPDPTMVLDAMAAVGGHPSATLVIGDTTYDIEMARAAGARSVGVSWGYHPAAALTAAGALTVIDDFRQLPDLVSALFAQGG